MIYQKQTNDQKALTVAVAFILACLLAAFFSGCASVPAVEDPCKDCPFTEREAPIFSPPELEPVPGYPELQAEGFTTAQVEADSAAYLQALTTDHLVLKAAFVEIRHLYQSLVLAIDKAISEATVQD